jgi:hypothetical protein
LTQWISRWRALITGCPFVLQVQMISGETFQLQMPPAETHSVQSVKQLLQQQVGGVKYELYSLDHEEGDLDDALTLNKLGINAHAHKPTLHALSMDTEEEIMPATAHL